MTDSLCERIVRRLGVAAIGTAFLAEPLPAQLTFVSQALAGGSLPYGSSPVMATTVADFNADGFLDVAFREDGPGTVVRLFWGPALVPPYQSIPFSLWGLYPLESGDLNGDGAEDLVGAFPSASLAGSQSGAVVIRYGPSLNIENVVTFVLPGGSQGFGSFIHVADLDGDGADDLISQLTTGGGPSAGQNHLQVLYGPSFSSGPTMSVPPWAGGYFLGSAWVDTDFTGDGLRDIFAVLYSMSEATVIVYPGPLFQSSNALLLGSPAPSPGSSGLAAGDWSGDGIADVVFATGSINVGGCWNIDLWGFASPGYGIPAQVLGPWGVGWSILASSGGDLNGDGALDLAVGYWPGGCSTFPPGAVRMGYGPSFLATQDLYGPSAGAAMGSEVHLGDVDGDGFMEIISPAGGDAKVMVFRPRTLTASAPGVSLSGGGSVSLSIDASPGHGGRLYFILASVTGSYPGTLVGNVRVPIVADSFTLVAAEQMNTPLFSNFAGTLDANGHATASLVVPAGVFSGPALVGQTIHFADVILNASQSGVQVSSNPVSITLQP